MQIAGRRASRMKLCKLPICSTSRARLLGVVAALNFRTILARTRRLSEGQILVERSFDSNAPTCAGSVVLFDANFGFLSI